MNTRNGLRAIALGVFVALSGCGGADGGGGNTGSNTPPETSADADGAWTWVSGSDQEANAQGLSDGVYGTPGTPSSSDYPGGRLGAASWLDSSGNLWIFGGQATLDESVPLNDLWRYSPATGQWTWLSGSNSYPNLAANLVGSNFGTEGVAAASNMPGSRSDAAAWTDAQGDLWLFGGQGIYGEGTNQQNLLVTDVLFNDLWEFKPQIGQWIWFGGLQSSTSEALGSYGTRNVPSAGNQPGARDGAVTWTDHAGNLWLFGGLGLGASATGQFQALNDLWRYSPSSGEWTWVSGSTSGAASGVYGTQGMESTSNVPGAREMAGGWVDASGNLWLFGGHGYDASGTFGYLSDLWEFIPTSGEWIWVSGADQVGEGATFGTLGQPAITNTPGARSSVAGFADAAGNFWLYGGEGLNIGDDLWRYDPSTATWTWMSGNVGLCRSNCTTDPENQAVVYGAQGIASATYAPGVRAQANLWVDASGAVWLFGGSGLFNGQTGGGQAMDDLWKFVPSSQ